MSGIGLVAGSVSLKSWRRYLASRQKGDIFCLGIWPEASDKPIGFHTARIADRRTALIGLVIGEKAWWGADVVVEVRRAVLDFLFGSLGVERAWGLVSARNFASIYNYHALGFIREGTLREHGTGAPGDRCDMLLFGILKEEWASVRRPREAMRVGPGW